MSSKGQSVIKTAINPKGLPFSAGMSQGMRVGNMLFLSGAVAIDKDFNIIGAEDPARQAQACLDNIELVLAEADASFANVFKLTCFAVSVQAAEAYMKVKAGRLKGTPPASTTVIVKELLMPGLLMEVEAIALLE